MLLKREDSMLLVVDVQERLLPRIHEWEQVLNRVVWLQGVARKLEVPLAATEQYPKGIGPTHPEVAALLPDGCKAEKTHFSCVAGGSLGGLPGAERRQVVLCGIEAHVCILQTALDLLAGGKEVFVVAEAVGSRNPEHKALALQRMARHGVEVVCGEMVAFEWLHKAGTPQFKELSAAFLR